ncbi:hypothetical protein TrRE_jg2650 [Triparma retinervis]|uniref:Spore protein YkvP/CgeB glycosyl transferase-like domain-containing protein n=1 Tax=Triparma retinervis TaxID=2557542 RepID=A0A9W7DNZ3_9STRA|nr:hypothetical protein TrRE_jg2650 [Triparma retinervis]
MVLPNFLLPILLLIQCVHPLPPVLPPILNISLHAQSKYTDNGWVAGSEVTTAGMKAIFGSHPSVNSVSVFSPFNYAGLGASFDLVITEGYTGTLPRFIHSIRASNPSAIVLHYLLDLYPHADLIMDLDVDGYLTNSASVESRVASHGFRSLFVPLAVDTKAFGASPTKTHLKQLLVEAADFAESRGLNFAIFGHGWSRHSSSFSATSVLSHYRGVLPLPDLPYVYSSSSIVLGTTEGKQEGMGMVNNRVFEALACGRRIILPVGEGGMMGGLREVFGEDLEGLGILTTDTVGGSVRRRLEEAWGGERENRRGREAVEREHTWDERMGRVMEWVRGWDREVVTRPNRPKIVLFRGEGVEGGRSIHEAMKGLHDEGFWDYFEVDGGELVEMGGNATFLKRVDVLLVEDRVGGRVEKLVRGLRLKEIRRKGIIYVGGGERDRDVEEEYDAVGLTGGGLGWEGGGGADHRVWDASNTTGSNLASALISRASLLPPRRASISVSNLTVEGSVVTAHAETRDFDCPRDGGWCVWLHWMGGGSSEDPALVSCVGDRNGGTSEVKIDENGREVEVINTKVEWDMEEEEGGGRRGEYELRISMHGGELGEGGKVGGFKEGWMVGSLTFVWEGVGKGGDEL